ncbi:putative membrane protein [Frateuria aurantia DSM 6220]|uniref:Putative membrane protein n=1 Tax=Frateuria aurantia (strain ATCC 33424 / DSM 6220 / KCTC 2777 / LMG 1558 / NBRC 3245 / NCIMB 13370) TaxID=767434 RepID=H8L0D7_FRAAD|nr:putative membrane protein [Frateuria aurantia DSM 6220]
MSSVQRQRSAWLPKLKISLPGDLQAWLFVFKFLLAMYVAGWIALRLSLTQPLTTMMTVVIVMHPNSGMVLAKSFYRAIGTVTGSLVMLGLMALFPQEPVLLLLSLCVWVGLCSGGAIFFRGFAAYAFVLSGYTAVIVMLPVVHDPSAVFNSAVMRVSEVLLGILVSAVISDGLMPQRVFDALRRSFAEQYAHFIDFMRGTTIGTMPREEMAKEYLRFTREAVALEDMRSTVVFENAEAHARSSRLRFFNQLFMETTTSFQAAHHFIDGLLRAGHQSTAQALIELYHPIGEALDVSGAGRYDSEVLRPRLDDCLAEWDKLASRLRGELVEQEARIEFDTGSAMLQRMAVELRQMVRVRGELAGRRLQGGVERAKFYRSSDMAVAGVTALRTFLTMGALSIFWIGSGWDYATSGVLLATVFSGLLAAVPRPENAVATIGKGALLGTAMSFVVSFWALPRVDGFLLLMVATLPMFVVLGALLSRPKTTLLGFGMGVGGIAVINGVNVLGYQPVVFLDSALGQLMGILAVWGMFNIIPGLSGSGWLRHRQIVKLRRQVVVAAQAPLDGLRNRFESISRDLLLQIVAGTPSDSHVSAELLAMSLSVHGVGRGLIELRRHLAREDVSGRWQHLLGPLIADWAQLYQQPDQAAWDRVSEGLASAIAVLRAEHDRDPGAVQLLLADLYYLRVELYDDESLLIRHVELLQSLPNGWFHAT